MDAEKAKPGDDDDEGANGAKAPTEPSPPVDMKTNYEGLYSDQHNIG